MRSLAACILFVVFLLTPTWAQDRVIVQSQGYQLKQSDVQPALELLVFLAQSSLTEQEIAVFMTEAITEFQAEPRETLSEFNELNTAIDQLKTIREPLQLGQARQLILGEFYSETLNESPEVVSPYFQLLFNKSPVVAYDPNTKVALTQNDLISGLAYLKLLNEYQGTQISDEELELAAQVVLEDFSSVDTDTQRLLASGTILLSTFQANLQNMNQKQKTNMASHFRQTVGGPPQKTTRGGKSSLASEAAYQTLSSKSLQNHSGMMDAMSQTGGSADYWTVAPRF